MNSLLRTLGALGTALLVMAGTASAQAPVASGTARFDLRVVDEADVPVAQAEIQLTRQGHPRLAFRTDGEGAVQVVMPAGVWTLTVRRFGFVPVEAEIAVDSGDVRLSLQVEHQATRLAGVRVDEDMPVSARLGDFERRRALGLPTAVITRADIERVNSPVLSRMLRGVTGVRIADSVGSVLAVSSRGAKPARVVGGAGFGLVPCVMRVTLDGVLLPALSNIDGIVPNDVHGIEVYAGPARLPPELAGLRTDNWCGVIAIWTRDR